MAIRSLAGILAVIVAGLAGCEPGDDAQPAPVAAAAPAVEHWAAELEGPAGDWRLRYRSTPDPIPRNELFELEIELLAATPGTTEMTISAVEARMPEHLHGTTLRPELVSLGDGRYRVEGLLFHMSGLWELLFSIQREAQTERARFEIVIE